MAKRQPPKYAHVVPGLPELPVEAESQTKIDMVKAKLLEDHGGVLMPAQLIRHYSSLRQKQDELKAQLSEVYLALEAATQLLADSNKQQEEGWGAYGAAPNTIIAANGDRIRVDVEPYAATTDPEAIRLWAIKEGLERKLALPWGTLNSLVKQRLLDGLPEPPGVKTFKKRTIVYTPLKPDAPPAELPEIVEEWAPESEPF